MHGKALSWKRGLVRVALATATLMLGSFSVAQGQEASCVEYAQKLCEKADPASCQAITMATGLMPAEACDAGLNDLNFSFDRLVELKKAVHRARRSPVWGPGRGYGDL